MGHAHQVVVLVLHAGRFDGGFRTEALEAFRQDVYKRQAFLRNDGAPGLATAAVLAGGVFNVFGDSFFVFTCDMGVFGAGLATALSLIHI